MGMERDAKKEQFWRGKMAEYEKAGTSVRAFCVRAGLREVQFYYWRRALKETKPPAEFVELVGAGGLNVGSGVSIRVDDRLSIVVERGFDEATLKTALACVSVRGAGR
jgi:hypothetical protein